MEEQRAKALEELQRQLASLKHENSEARSGNGTQENGHRLLEIRRRFNDELSALRVYLQVYRGRSLVEVSIWDCDEDGRWWITRQHCKIREYELLRVIETLMRAARILDGTEEPDWEELDRPA